MSENININLIKQELLDIINTTYKDRVGFVVKYRDSLYKNILTLTSFLDKDVKIVERVYCVLKDIKNKEQVPKCQWCGEGDVKFDKLHLGYLKYCCEKCRKLGKGETSRNIQANKTKEEKELMVKRQQETMMKNHGVLNASHLKEVQEKREQTMLNKFGSRHYNQSEEGKLKAKERQFRENDGQYFVQTDTFKNKTKEANIENYGVEYTTQRKDIKEKIKETNIEKYGVSTVLMLEENRTKSIERLKSREVIEKRNVTNTERYGGNSPFHSEQVKAKFRNNLLDLYGVDWITKREDVIEKIKDTKAINTESLVNKYIEQLDLPITFIEFEPVTRDKIFHCNKCEKDFEIKKDLFVKRIAKLKNNWLEKDMICTNCNKTDSRSSSDKERFIRSFIESFYKGELIYNTKSIISPKELDIYLPEIKFAIEFDGLYHHSETWGEKKYSYHLDKTKACEFQGITLIHIFEDELDNNQAMVFEKLKYLIKKRINTLNKQSLNLIQDEEKIERVFARDCFIKEISASDKNEFLSINHLQGQDYGTFCNLGLFYKDELKAVMTFSAPSISKGSNKNSGYAICELNRFAVKLGYNVIGGFSKLFSHFVENYKYITRIYSYADRRWSKGDVYEKNKFTLDCITHPSYWYIVDGQREHRFNYTKQNLLKVFPEYATKINEITSKPYTEYEIMFEQGIDRIWDCGHYKYVWNRA